MCSLVAACWDSSFLSCWILLHHPFRKPPTVSERVANGTDYSWMQPRTSFLVMSQHQVQHMDRPHSSTDQENMSKSALKQHKSNVLVIKKGTTSKDEDKNNHPVASYCNSWILSHMHASSFILLHHGFFFFFSSSPSSPWDLINPLMMV